MASDEVILRDWVLRLDGNVVEVMHKTGIGHRYHVNHVAVEAKPGEDGSLSLRVGIDVDGTIVEGAKIDVPAESRSSVEDLFGEARSRREKAGGPPAPSA
jgi:predicted transport protein